jgi:hypothetical protein
MRTDSRAWVPAALAWMRTQAAGAVCLVTGLPRSGKSRLLKDADAAGVFPRRAIYDPYATRDRVCHARGLSPSPPWEGYWIAVEDLVTVPATLDAQRRLVVYPRDWTATARVAWGFRQLAELLWATGQYDLVGEEAGLWSRWAVELLNRVVSGGGHALLRCWLVAQEWGRIYADARDCANAAIFFSPCGGRYRREIAQKCGPETVDRLDEITPGGPPVCWRAGEGVYVP